ncbi:gluconate 2-dehydrogenase subunit 3 family protein [Niabella ginsengisoli]|uniref:Gluconate 2-dehydrogenase subunit 3 family protein n=1 Tax=Niabella ginsengisoli TaxID=522298 RepID=A0ABS9SHS2_9BACT|nr:gluconate 2-dehydrogenase subunit 3 family protein [Niabella ginsengisoli]MCH5597909.1 gluconate 2-dehydrogenase subunit 3 family protein [Niabella ginsengisoli]
MAELIIPANDTPGALDANVADYIIHAVSEQLTRKDANNFISGLKEVEQVCRHKKKKDFLACNKKDQTDILFLVKERNPFTRGRLIHKIERKLRGATFLKH